MADTNEAKALAEELKRLTDEYAAKAVTDLTFYAPAAKAAARVNLHAELDRLAALAQQAGTAQQAQPSAAGAVEAKPVHWRAVLDPEQQPQQLNSSLHVVGFRNQRSAQGWIDSQLDFGGWRYTLEPLYTAAQPAAPAVPEGWQLVPKEPTEEMHAAAVRTIVRCSGNDDFPQRVYRAMLAAAPKAQPSPLDSATLAAIGRKHFGNPIPKAWYSAAKELLAAAPKALSPQTKGSKALESLCAIAAYLGIDPDAEQARPDYEPRGPVSRTFIRAIEAKVAAILASQAQAPQSEPSQAQPSADTRRLDWVLPNLHPATFGMEFEGGYDWDSEAELLSKWRAAIDVEIGSQTQAPQAPSPLGVPASPSDAWEVRVAGPDDVMQFADELSALRCANATNKLYVADCLRHPNPMDQVLCVATVHARGMEAEGRDPQGLDPEGATARSATPTRPNETTAPQVQAGCSHDWQDFYTGPNKTHLICSKCETKQPAPQAQAREPLSDERVRDIVDECAKVAASTPDKSGVNDDGQAWLQRATKHDCARAIRDRFGITTGKPTGGA